MLRNKPFSKKKGFDLKSRFNTKMKKVFCNFEHDICKTVLAYSLLHKKQLICAKISIPCISCVISVPSFRGFQLVTLQ